MKSTLIHFIDGCLCGINSFATGIKNNYSIIITKQHYTFFWVATGLWILAPIHRDSTETPSSFSVTNYFSKSGSDIVCYNWLVLQHALFLNIN